MKIKMICFTTTIKLSKKVLQKIYFYKHLECFLKTIKTNKTFKIFEMYKQIAAANPIVDSKISIVLVSKNTVIRLAIR